MSILGGNIRKLRDNSGLTQLQFGEIIGVAESTISLYESGKREPDNDTLLRIASHFNVTTDFLLGKEGNYKSNEATNKSEQNKRPRDLEKILEDHEIWFGKEKLNEQDKEEIRSIVELQLYKRAKELNKRKPKEDKPRD